MKTFKMYVRMAVGSLLVGLFGVSFSILSRLHGAAELACPARAPSIVDGVASIDTNESKKLTPTSVQDSSEANAPRKVADSTWSPAVAAEDFEARCHASGVVKCVGWDDPSDFIPARGGGGYADGLYPANDGTFHATMDTSIKTSGMGSLKFTMPPRATPNATGYWRANFGPLSHLTKFGPHTTLYLQFRLRLDRELLDFDWSKVGDTGWKVFIAYGPIPGPSCTGAQFVQENSYQRNIATAYTSCGSPPLYTNNGNPPMLLEQGDYNCSYNSGYSKNPKCFAYPANAWMTEYWVVEIGDFGKPNTRFTAYIASEGQALKKFIDLPNFIFNADAKADDALETIMLGPYLSGADGTKANPTAYMWFDELIISTKPIAAPVTRPAAVEDSSVR